ncbi:MAG: protein-L-isoaspartate(D-aspartate) O-methyltransferase [Sphingomonadaceae bacterium]
MRDYEAEREYMVRRQIAARGISDVRVLAAMREVPRERFVDEDFLDSAYADCALPIEAGQTISQPYIVALMIEAAELGPDTRVLEVGAGSGYAAAVMSRIGARVFAIERIASLAERARATIAELGYDNVEIIDADGTEGWPAGAPYDAILVSAGAGLVPRALPEQLAVGGRLLIPVGNVLHQRLTRYTHEPDGSFSEDHYGGVVFVPLIGAERSGA